MPNTKIRQASSGELEALLSLLQECIEGMRRKGIDQWDDVYPGRATVARDVEEATAFVATIQDVPVGMAVLNEYQAPEYADVPWSYGGRPAVVHRLMVSPTAEGSGIARALMAHLEARAKALGFDCIRLDAFMQNPKAVRFYDRFDYHRAGQVRFRKGEFHCYEKRL
jgi:ribosomal protein S18 acetylase RimI-like enzyme